MRSEYLGFFFEELDVDLLELGEDALDPVSDALDGVLGVLGELFGEEGHGVLAVVFSEQIDNLRVFCDGEVDAFAGLLVPHGLDLHFFLRL